MLILQLPLLPQKAPDRLKTHTLLTHPSVLQMQQRILEVHVWLNMYFETQNTVQTHTGRSRRRRPRAQQASPRDVPGLSATRRNMKGTAQNACPSACLLAYFSSFGLSLNRPSSERLSLINWVVSVLTLRLCSLPFSQETVSRGWGPCLFSQ